MSIRDLFERLRQERGKHDYTALEMPDLEGAYLAVDPEGRPCFFLPAPEILPAPSLRTSAVTIHPNGRFRLTLQDGAALEREFHGLICEATDPSDQETFCLVAGSFLSAVANTNDATWLILPFFHSLARLFGTSAAADLAAARQGLWGELFYMRECGGFTFWAPYWHSDLNRIFDFSTTLKRLEIKTTTGPERIHRFSHQQLYAIQGEEIQIASLMLARDEQGMSLRDLIEEARTALALAPEIEVLERAIRRAGMQQDTELGPKFNPNSALQTLEYFRSADAPHFALPEPPGVSETHYLVDLTEAPTIAPEEFRSWLQTWRATVPSAKIQVGNLPSDAEDA